ncbi:uncharacterized protein V6R79_005942 [Siganus canaliculatus]
MAALLLLLCCIEVLGALSQNTTSTNGGLNVTERDLSSTPVDPALSTPAGVTPEASSSVSVPSTTTAVSSGPTASTSSDLHTTAPSMLFYFKSCLPITMVTGGLIIVCTILLLSTLLLAWKVCLLSSRVKALSSNADLISNSEYWMGTAKKNKNKSEPEAQETSVLMASVSATQEDEGEKANAKEQKGEGTKKEVNGESEKKDDCGGEKSSSKTQEDVTNTAAKSEDSECTLFFPTLCSQTSLSHCPSCFKKDAVHEKKKNPNNSCLLRLSFSRHVLLKLPPNEALLELLLVLLLGLHALAVCPSVCSCSRSHREVDCSWRGLRQLPDDLQHNIHSLNVSHNRFHSLDGQLTTYTHLRYLDLSHNRLSSLPAKLPRSLWHLNAASNRLQLLGKNDTVYQWNLRTLDLSNNKLERAIFINNTLINLCTLNLSHNHFWTLPTNLPAHLETIDLSHNLLVRVLPGSLDRLPRLTHFFLQTNRFSTLPFGALDRLTSLRFIHLGNNPWACHLFANISYLLSWTQHTPARVLGCPCHTQPVCGGVRPGKTGGWHFASYNHPPLAASAQELSSPPPETSVTGWWYKSVSAVQSTTHTSSVDTPHHAFTATTLKTSTLIPRSKNVHPAAAGRMFHTDSYLISDTEQAVHSTSSSTFPLSDTSFISQTPIRTDTMVSMDRFFTTESPSIQTKKTTTLRTRSVRRKNQSLPDSVSNNRPPLSTCCFSLPLLLNLGLLFFILQVV